MPKKWLVKKNFHLISSAQNFQLNQYLFNRVGQRQIIQPVLIDLDILGHFVSIYYLLFKLQIASQ